MSPEEGEFVREVVNALCAGVATTDEISEAIRILNRERNQLLVKAFRDANEDNDGQS